MSSILKKKDYPINYSSEITDIIEAMTFTKGKSVTIVGSMSLKSQLYAGDYDMIEEVNADYDDKDTALTHLVNEFKTIVANLLIKRNCYIGDIKAGTIPEWKVIPDDNTIKNGKVVGFNASEISSKISLLMSIGIIPSDEGRFVLSKIKARPSPSDFYEIQDLLKYHTVRWTPATIKDGFTTLTGGRRYTLKEAFSSPSYIKLDVIAFVQHSRYTDFSILYLLQNRGVPINKVNMTNSSNIQSIKENIQELLLKNNYFKAYKRMFSLARKYKDTTLITSLNTILNSDLGGLYSVLSDIGTLRYLLENEEHLSNERILYELDQFRARLGNVYSINTPDQVLQQLLSLQSLPKTKQGRQYMDKIIADIEDQLTRLLSTGAKKKGTEVGILPISKKYRV